MVKLILTGAWVCIVTLATVYFSVVTATAPAGGGGEDAKPVLQLAKGETITVPVIAQGKVAGYFITRSSFMLDQAKAKEIKVPLTEYMTDALYTLLVGNRMVDIADTASFDLAAFRGKVKEEMNKRLGDEIVQDVLVEQLDFLAKSDTRTGGGGDAERMKKPVKIVAGEAAPAESPAEGAAEAPSGH